MLTITDASGNRLMFDGNAWPRAVIVEIESVGVGWHAGRVILSAASVVELRDRLNKWVDAEAVPVRNGRFEGDI